MAAALVFAPGLAHAGSYLDRAGVLVGSAIRDAEFLRKRLSDKELAKTLNKIAAARVEAARTMYVPPEIAKAHPHLMLVLENFERATFAATQGEATKFLEYVQKARDEESILRGILKQHGWTLPDS
jgi:hypothetical protein